MDPINRRQFLRRAGLVSAACLSPALVRAADPRPAGSFRPLFDGESLDGWFQRFGPRDHPKPGNFLVRDGAIWARQLPDEKGGLLLTEDTFRNFELDLEIHPDWGCDSGIFLRSNDQGRCIQIMNDYIHGGCVGFVYGQGTGGYISRPIRLFGVPGRNDPERIVARKEYDGVEVDGLTHSISAEEWNAIWKPGDYNAMRIRIEGDAPVIETFVNGTRVMGFDGRMYRGRHLAQANANDPDAPSPWDREKVESITGGVGHIGLQVHPGPRWAENGYSRYRNLRIRELP